MSGRSSSAYATSRCVDAVQEAVRVKAAIDRHRRCRTSQGSPGNLQDFEEMLFSNTDIVVAPIVLAVRVASNAGGDKVLGIATADATSRHFGICELPLTDTLADLEVRRRGERTLPEEATVLSAPQGAPSFDTANSRWWCSWVCASACCQTTRIRWRFARFVLSSSGVA